MITRLCVRIIFSFTLILFGAFSMPALAQNVPSSKADQNLVPESPIPFAKNISDQMSAALKKNNVTKNTDPQVLYQIVDEILLPNADLPLMARLALGREAWLAASSSEQNDFIKAFTQLMVRTYAAGMSSFVDQKFSPIRGGMHPGVFRVEMSSVVTRKDGPPVPIIYRVIYRKDDHGQYHWFVYDFSVEGISMLQSFRSQFAAKLSQGMSVAALTQELQKHDSKNNG